MKIIMHVYTVFIMKKGIDQLCNSSLTEKSFSTCDLLLWEIAYLKLTAENTGIILWKGKICRNNNINSILVNESIPNESHED